jgi:hypothetical protein
MIMRKEDRSDSMDQVRKGLNMIDGLLLSTTTLASFSEPTREEILAHYGIAASSAPQPVQSPVAAPSSADDTPPDLTVAMVRKLTKNVSDKTIAALRVIGKSDTPEFHMKDVIAAVDGAKTYMDLRGVWSAITRRSRAILDDPQATLIWWDDKGIYDDHENYIDHLARVSPITHQSLKTHFNL